MQVTIALQTGDCSMKSDIFDENNFFFFFFKICFLRYLKALFFYLVGLHYPTHFDFGKSKKKIQVSAKLGIMK